MAAAPINPSPDDISAVTNGIEFIKAWWGVLLAAAAVFGGAFYLGSRVNTIERTQIDLGDDIEAHDGRLKALEAARAAADIRIAEIPTRAEVTTRFDRIDARLDLAIERRPRD